MLEMLSLWTALPAVLLIAGACVLALWASRQPDQTTALIAHLTENKSSDMPCAAMRRGETEQENQGEDHVLS
jgi:hypothetical protein